MDKQSLTYKTLKNTSYNLIGYLWTFIFVIFITPLIVFNLGVEIYGIYILVLSINALIGTFNMGIGNTLMKYISEYEATNKEKNLKNLLYSFNSVLLVIGIFTFVSLALIGYLASELFPSSAITSKEYLFIFFFSGLTSLMGSLGTIFRIIPHALQRFDIEIKIGMASLTLSNLTILSIILLGFGLKTIFMFQFFYSIIFFFIFKNFSKKILPIAKLKFAWDWSELKKAYKFGISSYVINLSNTALTYFDRLLIPIFVGPVALTYYALPGNVASKGPDLASTFSATLFPMISGLNGLKDIEKIKNIYKKSLNMLTVLLFGTTISIIIFANKILLFWLDADFALRSTNILIILAITYYFITLGNLLKSFLLGLTKVKLLLYSSLSIAVFNFLLLLLLLPKFGIIGAAWAYLISVLPIIFMFYYTEKYIFKLNNRLSDYAKLYTKLIITSFVFIFLSKLIIIPLTINLVVLLFLGPFSVFLYLLIYRLFGFFDKENLEAIDNFILIIFKKIKNISHSKS